VEVSDGAKQTYICGRRNRSNENPRLGNAVLSRAGGKFGIRITGEVGGDYTDNGLVCLKV